MKKILLIVTIAPLISFAQKSTHGYAQLALTTAISNPLGAGIGGSFLVGKTVGKQESIGAGFDILKYKSLNGISPSVYGDFRFYASSDIKKPIIYFCTTPGYFIYSQGTQTRYSNTTIKGGFLFGAGIGCIFYAGHGIAPFINLMYNNFPLVVNLDGEVSKTNYNILKICFGVKF